MAETDATAGESPSFFAEGDDALELVRSICSVGDEEKDGGAGSSSSSSPPAPSPPAAATALVRRFGTIIQKYQEQPTLLDSHMEGMVSMLMEKVRAITRSFHAQLQEQDELPGSPGGGTFRFSQCSDGSLHLILESVYLLCKTRGYKAVIKYFPHEVADLEPALKMLESQDPLDHHRWQTRYVLLLWLSILAIVPFNLGTIDSSGDLVATLIDLGKGFLGDAGATCKGGALLLAKLLSRRDMESFHLTQFLEWAASLIIRSAEEGPSDPGADLQTIGAYMTLVEIFKHGHRESLLPRIDIVCDCVVAANEARARDDPRFARSTVLRKLSVKLAQRIALQYMPPRVLSWRYERGQRSLMDNLSAGAAAGGAGADAGSSSSSSSSSSSGSGDGGGGSTAVAGDPSSPDDSVDVPEELEELIEQLLMGLRDADTTVRWSSAKGIGRVTGRLPQDFGDDVVQEVLHLFSEGETHEAWHGGCLSLGELARRGLLLPTRLEGVVPLVVRAITYDVRRGPHR